MCRATAKEVEEEEEEGCIYARFEDTSNAHKAAPIRLIMIALAVHETLVKLNRAPR